MRRLPGPPRLPLIATMLVIACGTTPSPGPEDRKPIPHAAARTLERALDAALATVPAPPDSYRLDPDLSETRVPADAPWDSARRRYLAPAPASAERVFFAGGRQEDDEVFTIEVRVRLNEEPSLPTGLASEGTAPRLLPIAAAPAVLVTTVGAEEGGRVAVPLSPEQAAHAITVVRLYVGRDREAVELAVRRLLEGRESIPPTLRPTSKADEVQTVTVELYGPRAEVERMARAISIDGLRRIVRP